MELKLNAMQEIEEGADIEICEWTVNDGDSVKKGDKIAEVLVGKASVEVTAPADGTIHIKAEESEIVSGDDVIAEIE